MIKIFKTIDSHHRHPIRQLQSVSPNYPYMMIHYLRYGDTLDSNNIGFSCIKSGYYRVIFFETTLESQPLESVSKIIK